MTRSHSLTLLATTATLAGCGGGGGGGASTVASTPPPVTVAVAPNPAPSAAPAPTPAPAPTIVGYDFVSRAQLPSTPGNTPGIYDAIGLESYVFAREGNVRGSTFSDSVRIAVDPLARTYTLTIPNGPAGTYTAAFSIQAYRSNAGPDEVLELGYATSYRARYSDGTVGPVETQAVTRSSSTLRIPRDAQARVEASLGIRGIGQLPGATRFVSLGEWAIFTRDANGEFAPTVPNSQGLFAFGDRTAASDLPVSGTATYRIVDDTGIACGEEGCSVGFAPDEFSVDFAARTIGARLNRTEHVVLNEFTAGPGSSALTRDFVISTSLSGTAPIGTASNFLIDLTGTGTVVGTRSDGGLIPDVARPLTGLVNGGFFGPAGSELGGAYRAEHLFFNGEVAATAGAFTAVRN